VEPSTSVGTELLFENDVVRVWSLELAPGEASPFHRHELDYVYVYVTPSTLAYMGEPGRVERVREYGDGYVRYTSVGSGIQHHIRNVAETVHRQVLVELKTSHGQAPTEDNGRLTDVEPRNVKDLGTSVHRSSRM
jgi:quercetin dioxygenase-like cupin family protein